MVKNHSYPPFCIGAIVEENSKVKAPENKLLERKKREVGVLKGMGRRRNRGKLRDDA